MILTEIETAEIPGIYRRFADVVGDDHWKNRIVQLKQEMKGNRFLADYLRSENSIAFQLEHLRELITKFGIIPAREINEHAIYPAASFAAQTLSIMDGLPNKVAGQFKRRIHGAIKNPDDMRGLRLELTALLMLATAPAWAEWVKVDETDEVVIYVDPATIRKDGNLRRIWEMQDLKARDSDGSLSRRALSEYDCKGKRLRLRSLSTHSGQMATGKIIITVSPSGKWDYAAPGTSGQTMLKFVCAR